MKTEVYSWRVSAQKKADLEGEAQRQGTSLAGLLDQITEKWLAQRQGNDDAEQAALRTRVLAAVGTVHGNDPTRSQRAGEQVREIIRKKHEQERARNARRRTD